MILGGAALITLPGLRGGTIDLRGLLWAIPSPLVYSLYLAINSRLLRHYPPLVGAGGLFLGMAIMFSAMAAFLGLDIPTHPATWLLVLLIALGPGALTMTLFSYSVPKLGATNFSILANAELVTVVAIGILVLGEAMTPDKAIGGALIVAGIVTHALSRKRALQAPARPPLRTGLPPPLAGEGWGGGNLWHEASHKSSSRRKPGSTFPLARAIQYGIIIVDLWATSVSRGAVGLGFRRDDG